MATEPRGLLGKKIAEVAPGDLKKTLFCLGGAEANENAIKLARFYTGRHKILARYRSYHGATHGALALTGDYRRLPAVPTIPGVVHFLDPYCYRCPFGWTEDITITVQGYLTFKEQLGKRQVSLPAGCSLGDLLASLRRDIGRSFTKEAFNQAGELLEHVAILLNGIHYRHLPDGLNTILKGGDQVAIFPPLAGGC